MIEVYDYWCHEHQKGFFSGNDTVSEHMLVVPGPHTIYDAYQYAHNSLETLKILFTEQRE